MGSRALLNVSKEEQNKLTPMQTRVKGAPRSMNDPQAKAAPAKEAIEEVLRQCESPLLVYAIKMVRDGEQAQEIVQDVASPLGRVSVGQASARLAAQPFTDYDQPEIAVARRGVAYGVNPFASCFN